MNVYLDIAIDWLDEEMANDEDWTRLYENRSFVKKDSWETVELMDSNGVREVVNRDVKQEVTQAKTGTSSGIKWLSRFFCRK